MTMTTTTDARRMRLERLGAYSERDQADEAYRRRKRAEMFRRHLPADREHRARVRANREADEAKRHRAELYQRREQLYAVRYFAIADRVQSERKIRPAGKSVESERRYRRQMSDALAEDREYRALADRDARYHDRMRRIEGRRANLLLLAGIKAVDDRATRRAKVRAWIESGREEAS